MHQYRPRWTAAVVALVLIPCCASSEENGGVSAAAGASSAPEPGCGGTGAGGVTSAGAAGSGGGAAGVTGSSGVGAGGSAGGGPPAASVTVHLEKNFPSANVISFGVPVAPGTVTDVARVEVRVAGSTVPARVRELIAHYDAAGNRASTASIGVQLSGAVMTGNSLDVEVIFAGQPLALAGGVVAFADAGVSTSSAATARTTVRTIASVSGSNVLTEAAPVDRTLFVGREPKVMATFPEGYLAATGVLGPQTTAAAVSNSGMKFLSDAFKDFTLTSMYVAPYAFNPHPESTVDPIQDFTGWLYDRCATYLTAYSHFGDGRYLRHAFKSCSYYGDKIGLTGAQAGIFTGKPEPDTKYSHARGVYAYYALTGDEAALEAGKAMAAMWLNDVTFVTPYRQGHLRGLDKLWTERLLATSLEGLLYGHRLTGDKRYLDAVKELVNTSYKHVTGDAAALAAINPGTNFPPQNCFIHSAAQQAEDDEGVPWCSPWMSELLVDALIQYQEQTGDARVDEIFVRLGRFLRDVGTAYFTTDPLDDTFLKPSVCDDPAQGENRRRLVPLYGVGLNAANSGDWADFEHCSDATALSAAALRALVKRGEFAKNPIGPFASEGESLLALHRELASCAHRTFAEQTRAKRSPSSWTSAELAAGISDPQTFIDNNKIGFPTHVQMPQRKLSWWFNTSMLGLRLLSDAAVSIGELDIGKIQPAGCAQ
jgi:hypothetical protein